MYIQERIYCTLSREKITMFIIRKRFVYNCHSNLACYCRRWKKKYIYILYKNKLSCNLSCVIFVLRTRMFSAELVLPRNYSAMFSADIHIYIKHLYVYLYQYIYTLVIYLIKRSLAGKSSAHIIQHCSSCTFNVEFTFLVLFNYEENKILYR